MLPSTKLGSWQGPVENQDLRNTCCQAHSVSVRDDRPCFVLHNVLSIEECSQIVDVLSSKHDVTPDSLEPGVRSQFSQEDVQLSLIVWGRIFKFFPKELDGGSVIGLQTTWRHAKYFPGQSVMAHMDFRHTDNQEISSRISFTLYLNEDFSGGETSFVYGVDNFGHYKTVVYDNKPRTGSAICFYQEVPEFYHCAKVVQGGFKSIMRADVMYRFPQVKD